MSTPDGTGAAGGRGTCYGYAVTSDLPFHYLRHGEGEPLEITLGEENPDEPDGEPLLEWKPTPEVPFDGRLHQVDGGFRLWAASAGWFDVAPRRRRISVPRERDVVRREERLWGIPAALCFVARGDLALHAAAVEIDGQAVILGAPRTFGKTTLAAALAAAGHRLLSEDVTCVRLRGDGPVVVPGPAMLRLRHDVAERIDVPGTTRLADQDDRVHLAIDPQLRGDCAPVPLAAIMLLRRAETETSFEPVDAARAIPDLWNLSFRLPTSVDRARCFAAATDLARSTRVIDLHRPVTYDALPGTVDQVAESL